MKKEYSRKFCVAPMMGYTTPHARKLYRMLSKKAFLFTEMIPAKTMLYSKTRNLVIENENQNPIALQVGGSEIEDLKKCSKIAISYNYDEINLNLGCPSKAVQKGSFGACLMQQKTLVRNCVEAMLDSASIEVSIKCRIGIGNKFDYDFFYDFINELSSTGIKIIYVHARNAILSGFSPKKNRTVPPLNYNFVQNIKKDFPKINFILNGGINSIQEAYSLSDIYDGVMVGRLVQNNPFCLLNVDEKFYKMKKTNAMYEKIILEYFEYIKKKLKNDSIFRLLSPLLKIFFGVPNSKYFRNKIHEIIKSNEIDLLESLFLEFVEKKINKIN